MILSVSDSNYEILNNIKELYINGEYECDLTYSLGSFYKGLNKPKYKYDKYPQTEDTHNLDDFNKEIEDNSLSNIVVDPPFIVQGKLKCNKWINDPKKGQIMKRYNNYHSIEECFQSQDYLLELSYSKLIKDGILVYKIQNCKSNKNEQVWTKTYVENKANELGFELLDEFIKINTRPLPNRKNKLGESTQRCARKSHSYFLVFKKI